MTNERALVDRRESDRRNAAADALAVIRVEHYPGAERRRAERRADKARRIENAKVAHWMARFEAARKESSK